MWISHTYIRVCTISAEIYYLFCQIWPNKSTHFLKQKKFRKEFIKGKMTHLIFGCNDGGTY